MVNSLILHRLARDPAAHARFVATGRLPRTVEPASPLIFLLERFSPRDRALIRGLRIGPELGYQGSRTFHNAEQALRWLKPQPRTLEDDIWPAESWRIKHFTRPLHVEQLLAHCSTYPPGLRDRYR